MSFDVDDVLAVCMAHALHDLHEAHLIAIVHDSGYPDGVGAVDVLNRFYRHDVPIGAYKGPFGPRTKLKVPPLCLHGCLVITPLAAPGLGSCASPARGWRLRAARHSQG